MKTKLTLFTIIILSFFFFSSCKREVTKNPSNDNVVSPGVLAALKTQGFNTSDVVKVSGGYLVEGDIFMTEASIMDTSGQKRTDLIIAKTEQYSTTNLITSLPRVINVSIIGFASNYVVSCDTAINRWNSLKLGFTFQRVSSSADISIQPVTNQTYLGSSGFPSSNGNPYTTISLNTTQLDNYANQTNYIAAVIQHEMGHCVGLRHTDFMDRAVSCGGTATNEGAGTVGAIIIPGAPSMPDATSIMLACTGTSARDFNTNDKVALNYLYGTKALLPNPFYRFYMSSIARHFYTADYSEGISNSYTYESTMGSLYIKTYPNASPLYRFRKTSGTVDYLYQFSNAAVSGYVVEGICGWAYSSPSQTSSSTTAVYRFYSTGGGHFYTTNYSEGVNGGLSYEGIGFYLLQ